MNNQSKHIVTCHECTLVVNIAVLNERQKARCPRCGFTLTTKRRNAIDRILAFAFAALIFLLLSLPFDFLSFQANGINRKIELLNSLQVLINNNYHFLALLELLTVLLFPALVLLLLIYLLIPLRKGLYPRWGASLLKLTFSLMPWSMVEVFVVGTLISLIKVISLADISLGASFYAYLLFSLMMTAAIMHVDKHQLQQLLTASHQLKVNEFLTTNTAIARSTSKPSNTLFNNSKQYILAKRMSIQKTWALLITATVFYVPANILPIMNTRFLGQDDPSTILGGVILLWGMGSYPIAIIIFIASVVVPLAKMFALAWLNYSVQHQHSHYAIERVKLYRLAEFVGRWSMVDIFVVIILVSLIQLGNSMSIYPGGGALAFAGVVITTMLAAMSFEPKFIWQTEHTFSKQSSFDNEKLIVNNHD